MLQCNNTSLSLSGASKPVADLQLNRHRICHPDICDTSDPVIMNAVFVGAVLGHRVGSQLLFLFFLRMTGKQDGL